MTLSGITVPSSVNSRLNAVRDDGGNIREAYEAILLGEDGMARRMSSDAEFERALRTRDCYAFKGHFYLLTTLENSWHAKDPLDFSGGAFSIDHIMPQNALASAEWREMLGDDCERVYEGLISTLGNLPLTAYNSELSDAPYCLKCKHAYVYDYVTYGHLGGYRCPNCGYARPATQVSVSKVISSDTKCSQVEFTQDGKMIPATINLPGGYNIYNAATAMAVGKALGFVPEKTAASLGQFSCGFGRMEQFEIHGTSLRMILIKNPAGCNQVLNFLTDTTEPFIFVACLNDRAQDGKDVSWIWDVDFERLIAMEQLEKIVVSGIRADDMAMRFKYAGMPEEKIEVIRDYGQLVESLTAQDKPVYIMPTYTAMLELRGTISKNYGFKAFWE